MNDFVVLIVDSHILLLTRGKRSEKLLTFDLGNLFGRSPYSTNFAGYEAATKHQSRFRDIPKAFAQDSTD